MQEGGNKKNLRHPTKVNSLSM